MTFARPLWLLAAIAALGVFVMLYRRFEKRRSAQALAYSNLDFALDAMKPSPLPGRLLSTAWIVGAAAVLLALAGPHFWTRVPAKDGTVVLCIDTSGSMRAHDLFPSRWSAAKAAARSFIDEVPSGTRVGIVTFATGASLIQPPSAELDEVRDALDRIPAPDGATAIGDALQLAAQQMPEKGKRVIVLMTDGVNNRGADPIESARAIGQKGISIYAVGIGTSGSGEVIPGTNELADLDSDALRTIAQYGNGTYSEASASTSLADTFRRLAMGTVWESKRIDGSYPVALAGGLVLMLTFLAGLGFGRFP